MSLPYSVEKWYNISISNEPFKTEQRDIKLFLENHADTPYEVIGDFIEVKSGKDNTRKKLNAAIALSKKEKAISVVAKLDRLSRRVGFIASLMEDRELDFKLAQMPYADKFQLHIYSALAEQERSFIGSRPRSVLKSWKERNLDKKLGAPRHHIERLAKARKKKARHYAEKVSGVIFALRKQSASLKAICDSLNVSGLTTSRGHPSTNLWFKYAFNFEGCCMNKPYTLYEQEVLSRGSYFLDVYNFAVNKDGENNKTYMCDNHHLSYESPSVLFENHLYKTNSCCELNS